MEQFCIDKGVSEFGCGLISWGLYFGYLLFFLAVAAVVVLPLMNAIKEPKELLKSGAAIALLAVIFLLSYGMSGDEVSLKAASLGVTPGSSKMIGAGLIMLYITFTVAVGCLFYSFVNKALK